MSNRTLALKLGNNDRRGPVTLAARYANRHGLITGATGSGKTRSLIRLASEFNRIGVPVFAPDLKGDLADLVARGIPNRVPAVRLIPGVNFFLNMRELGGDLCARAMGLSDAQRGALDSALDAGACTPADVYRAAQGSKAGAPTLRALYRGIGRLDAALFRADGFDVAQLIAKPAPITVLHARELAEQGASYAVTLCYMLRELYQRLPEVGDRAAPVLAFFIDEAHMLFSGAPAELVAEIERMVRLIRSRGVSLWFVTQSPADLPDSILAQLQNRVQHSLRAVTPKDWRGVRTAVDTMPPGDFLDPVATLGKLPPGQAMVSLVGRSGQPGHTELCHVDAPDYHPAEMTTGDIMADLQAFTAPKQVGPSVAQHVAAVRRARPRIEADVFAWGVAKIVAGVVAFGIMFGLLVLGMLAHQGAHPRRRGRH